MEKPFLEYEDENLTYNPFEIPANLRKATKHAEAKMVGKHIHDSLDFCPCCNMSIEYEKIDLNCEIKELSFLGCAFPFYFYYLKMVLVIIGIFFFVGGSFNLFIININCHEECVKFIGIGILNYRNLPRKVNDQSWSNTVVTIIMLAVVFYLKPNIYNAMQNYNKEVMSSRNYTVLVRNLPKDITPEILKNFFEELIKYEVVKVNFAFELNEYKSYFDRKVSVLKKIYKINQNLNDQNKNQIILEEYQKELIEAENNMESFKKQCGEENYNKFCGAAFVTFRSQLPVKVLLDHWGMTTYRQLKYFFLGKFANVYLKINNKTIFLHMAPDPSDVVWENLSFSFWISFLNHFFFYFVALLILALSFYIQCQVVRFTYKFRFEKEKEYQATNSLFVKLEALVVSIMILITNFLLRISIYYYCSYIQKIYCYSKFYSNYINVYILLVFFNSAFMPYLILSVFESKTTSEQLIYNIHIILLGNAFSTPLYKCVDPIWIFKIFMKKYMKSFGDNCPFTQYEANYWFEGPSVDIAENYAYVTRVLYLTTWFASCAPLGVIFCIFGLVFNYWLDKYMLLRINCYPESVNENIIVGVIYNLEILPFIFLFGAIQYTARMIISMNLFDYVITFALYGITSTSLTVCLAIYMIFFKQKKMTYTVSDMQYDDAKYLFLNEYDRENPITHPKANEQWIQYLKETKEIKVILLLFFKGLQKSELLRKAATMVKSREATIFFVDKTIKRNTNLRRIGTISYPHELRPIVKKEPRIKENIF